MYSRSITERIKIQFEIMCEASADLIRRHSLRTPLIVMAMVAVMMTLKNARTSIDMIKGMSGSPFASKKSSSSFFSPYGRTAGSSTYGGDSSYPGSPASPYGGVTSPGQYSGARTQQYGGQQTQYGGQQQTQQQYGGQQTQQQYGGQQTQQQYGGQQQAQYGGMNAQPGAPAYNPGNLRGTAMSSGAASMGGQYGGSAGASAGFQTSSLVQKYGNQVQSMQPGLFYDFTSAASFMGQIETLSAPDAPNFVQQTLQSPGAGKVLVVDGGGSMNSALFDSNMAMVAQQNGWKGVVINGFVLDPPALHGMLFGVKALGSLPTRGMQQMGQRGIPLTIAGLVLNPGAWIYVDRVSWRRQIAVTFGNSSLSFHVAHNFVLQIGWHSCQPTEPCWRRKYNGRWSIRWSNGGNGATTTIRGCWRNENSNRWYDTTWNGATTIWRWRTNRWIWRRWWRERWHESITITIRRRSYCNKAISKQWLVFIRKFVVWTEKKEAIQEDFNGDAHFHLCNCLGNARRVIHNL